MLQLINNLKLEVKKLKFDFMTPSLSAFLSSVFLAVIIVIIPIAAALVFVSSSDKIIRS